MSETEENRLPEDEEAQMEDEDESETSEKDQFEVERIVDVRKVGRQLEFRIHWKGYPEDEDTWELEAEFRAKSHPLVVEMLNKFKEGSDKVKQMLPKKRGRPPKKKTWEYVPAEPDLSQDADRELRPDDEFFGERACEVSGEKKKLYDPSHKTSSTEIFLSKVNSSERVTRQKMRQLTAPKEEALPSVSRARSMPTIKRKKSVALRDKAKEAETPSSSQTPEPMSTPIDSQSPPDTTMDSTVSDGPDSKRAEATDSQEQIETERTDYPTGNASWADPFDAGDVMPEPIDDEEQMFPREFPYDAPLVKNLDWTEEIRRAWVPHNRNTQLTQQMIIDIVKRCDAEDMELAVVTDLEAMKDLLMYKDFDGFNFLHKMCASNLSCKNDHYPDDMVSLICRGARNRRALISAGCGVDGQTPLHLVVNGGMVCRARTLLKYKAPLGVMNMKHQTPLQLAYERNHAKMTKLLLEAGSNYADLEMIERRKQPNERKRRAFDVLDKHANQMSNLLFITRNRVYSGFEEVDVVSPVFTMNGFDKSGTFYFRFEPYALPSANYTYLLFISVCNFKGQWTARCWDGPRFAQGFPRLNGEALEPMQESDTPMIFYSPFNQTEQKFEIELQDGRCPFVIALQAVLVKTFEPEVPPVEMPDASTALEYAPLVGPV